MNSKDNINFIFQLNNKNRSGNFFALFIVSGIVFVGAGFYFVATNMTYALIATIVAAVAYFILFSKAKPSFFEMLVSEKQIQFNYYSVSTTTRNYQSIEIELNQLKDFTIVSKIGGLQKNLIVSVQSKFGIADFPPISISILKRNEIAQVLQELNEIQKANVKK
jgi:hypothetical protein